MEQSNSRNYGNGVHPDQRIYWHQYGDPLRGNKYVPAGGEGWVESSLRTANPHRNGEHRRYPPYPPYWNRNDGPYDAHWPVYSDVPYGWSSGHLTRSRSLGNNQDNYTALFRERFGIPSHEEIGYAASTSSNFRYSEASGDSHNPEQSNSRSPYHLSGLQRLQIGYQFPTAMPTSDGQAFPNEGRDDETSSNFFSDDDESYVSRDAAWDFSPSISSPTSQENDSGVENSLALSPRAASIASSGYEVPLSSENSLSSESDEPSTYTAIVYAGDPPIVWPTIFDYNNEREEADNRIYLRGPVRDGNGSDGSEGGHSYISGHYSDESRRNHEQSYCSSDSDSEASFSQGSLSDGYLSDADWSEEAYSDDGIPNAVHIYID